MNEQAGPYASGNWHVTDDKGDEFMERWTTFLTWTKDANEGFMTARLLRDATDPNHFVSFATWRDLDTLDAWRQKPEFAEHFGACRALCTDMNGGNYDLVRTI